MPRYQLRRPVPIKVLLRNRRWQTSGPSGALLTRQEVQEEEVEVDEGPESPDSPGSSDSSASGSSEDDSDSDDDEVPSPTESGAPSSVTEAVATLGPYPTTTLSSVPFDLNPPLATLGTDPTTSNQAAVTSVPSSTTSLSPSTFTGRASSQGLAAALPQITADGSTMFTVTRLPATTTTEISSRIPTSTQPTSLPSSRPSSPSSGFNRAPVADAENDAPRKSSPPQPTLMSKGAQVAAITLSIFGALALVIAAVFYYKRRKRTQSQRGHTGDSFSPDNAGSLRAPEVVHIDDNSTYGAGSHLTRSTARSNTLFGAGPYERPETVSTNAGRSRVAMPEPTPNPFADPPLNKAYDVLAGRPRSTTLTDRGSWVRNPFKDPESGRFDPFGELQAKARMERVKYMEQARKEAEIQRQFEEKERMGLVPDQVVLRSGSGVTIEGLGVLDRANGRNGYP